MKSFFAALQFLTIIPLPRALGGDESSLRKSVIFFPIIGALIGTAAALSDFMIIKALPQTVVTVLVVIFLMAVSGGLHMDGLADTADGFFSSRPRERILEIMKDSRIGAMGVMAIVSVLMLKVSLLDAVQQPARWPVIILMPVAGRCALVIMMKALPYVRQKGGLAAIFQDGGSSFLIIWSIVFLCAAGWFSFMWAGIVAALASLTVVLLFIVWCHLKIGGFTGDTLGAVCELAEAVPPLAALVCMRCGLIS